MLRQPSRNRIETGRGACTRRVAAALAGIAVLVAMAPGRAETTPRWERPEGTQAYTLSVETEVSGNRETDVVAFDLETPGDGTEWIRIRSLHTRMASGDSLGLTLPDECRAQLGGDEEFLAVFPVQGAADLSERVPSCTPEKMFTAITDILMLVALQSDPRFGLAKLTEKGDSAPSKGFLTTAQNVGKIQKMRIRCSGGTVELARLTEQEAIVLWKPSPFAVDILRTLDRGMNALFSGPEQFAATVTVNPNTGELVRARSVNDEIRLGFWAPYGKQVLPDPKSRPVDPPETLVLRRYLKLEKAVAAGP